MAITITPELSNQSVSSSNNYKYLFEPLRVKIIEAGSKWAKITVKLREIEATTIKGTYTDYFFSETNINGIASVDLMEMARDFVGSGLYQISQYSDLIARHGVFAPFRIDFSITTNLTSTPTVLLVVPIVGGRSFEQFSGNVLYTNPLTEWEYYGLTQPAFKGYPFIKLTLKDPSVYMNINPLTTGSAEASADGRAVCGGYLIWKSRFGGWMTYGFDIMSETEEMEYKNDSEVSLLRANEFGHAFVPVNYTQIETSYSVSLKALSVSKEEAQALRGLSSAPVAYLMRSTTSKMELMRITGTSIPMNNLANGVDVQVSLSSISVSTQNVR